MNIKTIAGYILAGIGLIGIFLSTDNGKKLVPFLADVKSTYILIASGVLVIAGVIFMVLFGKAHKQKHEEVPIYEGQGRKRKVVAYQRS